MWNDEIDLNGITVLKSVANYLWENPFVLETKDLGIIDSGLASENDKICDCCRIKTTCYQCWVIVRKPDLSSISSRITTCFKCKCGLMIYAETLCKQFKQKKPHERDDEARPSHRSMDNGDAKKELFVRENYRIDRIRDMTGDMSKGTVECHFGPKCNGHGKNGKCWYRYDGGNHDANVCYQDGHCNNYDCRFTHPRQLSREDAFFLNNRSD